MERYALNLIGLLVLVPQNAAATVLCASGVPRPHNPQNTPPPVGLNTRPDKVSQRLVGGASGVPNRTVRARSKALANLLQESRANEHNTQSKVRSACSQVA